MILEILAYPLQRMMRGDTDPLEMVGIADARKLQNMRGADGTGG